ncbi:MAG: UbiA family prenyltransferase [Phycisphaeraceae bacterium]|nr:UbiA family prenyltransferase [Phycisphaeraceae bacterium]
MPVDRSWIQQALGLLRLVRTPLMFAGVSNAWLMVWLTRSALEHHPDAAPSIVAMPLGQVLLLTTIVAVGLQTFASALNDALDARHDRLFHPGRPLPLGLVDPTATVVLSLVGVLVAIAAAAMLGTGPALICIVVSFAILTYNTLGKFVPAVGLVFLGLIRAGFMFVPNPEVVFAWPIWLAMTHMIACAAIAHVLQGKRPPLNSNQIWFLTAGWFFWTMLLVGWILARDTGQAVTFPWIWLGPAVPALVMAIWTYRLVSRLENASRRARRTGGNHLAEFAIIWLILYDAGWLFGMGRWDQGCVHIVLFAGALAWARLLRKRSGQTPAYTMGGSTVEAVSAPDRD